MYRGNGIRYSPIYIPNTTWTEGRNLMLKEAIDLEKEREKEYDFWLLADDDFTVNCAVEADIIHGYGSCWQKLFNFVGSEHVKSDKVSSVFFSPTSKLELAATSYTDAILAIFKRSSVPYLLPYATLEDGNSEWSSQAALFCLMETCYKQTTLMAPLISGINKEHRDYIRGLDVDVIQNVIKNNYYFDVYDFYPCKDKKDFRQYADKIVARSGEELMNMIPKPAVEYCYPLKKRFTEFAKNTN